MSVHPERHAGRRPAGHGALTRALDRWRRGSPPTERVEPAALTELARRLDDAGCAHGRVSASRLDGLTRAYDRLETKLNAVLMAAMGTFLSTLASLLLYYVRGGTH